VEAVAVAVVVVVDGTVGVELGTLVLGPGLVVATDFDELPPPEQPARISAPAATMTGMSSLPLRLRTRIRMSARYRPGEMGHLALVPGIHRFGGSPS
jgi:hypothetical protein